MSAEPSPASNVASPNPGHHGPVHTHCENCGTALAGPYCHHCGQHDFEFHRSFSHVFLEALENFFHFDSKLFRNTVTLLFRPGRLSAEFNAGKRAAQVPPFRLYLFVSFVFFAIQFFGTKETASAPAAETATHPPQIELIGPFKITLQENQDSAFSRFLSEKGRRAFARPNALRESFAHSLPRFLLISLPFFALYTRFLFRRAGPTYLQHLVIALHFHTFLYLFLLFRQGWVDLFHLLHLPSLAGLLAYAGGVWLCLYPGLMLRHLFNESWPRVLGKTTLLVVAYLITLLCVFFWDLVFIIANT